jgi:hypothetical protein
VNNFNFPFFSAYKYEKERVFDVHNTWPSPADARALTSQVGQPTLIEYGLLDL